VFKKRGAISNFQRMSKPTLCVIHFQSPLLIQNFSLASKTNLHLDPILSSGRATMSLWLWPGNLKCTPTGFTVSLWQGWVTVPTCSLNLFLKGLSVEPMY
jgi:hypothetical protein